MKFTTSFLTVLAATVTLAQPSYKECMEVYVKKYGDCRSLAENDEYNESYCKLYETELCHKLFNNSIKDTFSEFPECKSVLEDEKEIEKTERERIGLNNFSKIVCAKDEQGNLCPYSPANTQTYINLNNKRKNESFKSVYMEAIKDSCESKKCVDEFLSILEIAKKYNSDRKNSMYYDDGILDIEEVSSIFNSETCAARYGKNSVNGNNNVSNGNTNGNTDTSNGNANGATNNTNGNANDKTNASNGNAKDKTDAKSGAIQVSYSRVLFIGIAILLSNLL